MIGSTTRCNLTLLVLFASVLFLLPPAAECRAAATAERERELIVWGAWRRKGLDAAFRRFEQEHPGWRIVLSTAAGAGQMDPQKLMCGIAGGSPPDTLIQDRLSIGEWAIRDAFMPLDELIAQSLEEEALAVAARQSPQAREQLIERLSRRGASRQLDLARRLSSDATVADELIALCQGIRANAFYEACWREACFEREGVSRVYGIPNTTDVRVLYYNEDLLGRAGFVDATGRARPPRDWDELRDYAVKLTERDARGNITRLGFAPLYGQGFLYHYGWLNGGQFMSADARTCTVDSPPVDQALRYVLSIYEGLGGVERVESFQSSFGANELDPFLTGKIAMKIDSDFHQTIIAQHAPHLRFGIVPVPAPAGREPLTWSGGFAWVIPRGAPNAEMAFELIRFLMTDRVWRLRAEVEARVASSRGRFFIPEMAPLPHVNRDVFDALVRDHPDLPRRFKQNFLAFTELMKTTRFRPVTPVGQVLWDEQVRAAEKALRGQPPAQTLARSNAIVQERLDAVWRGEPGRRLNWWYVVSPMMVIAAAAGVFMVRGPRRNVYSGRAKGEAWWGYGFAAPWLIGFLALTAGPIVASLVYSFCSYDVLHEARFIGVENYRRLFAGDPLFWKSLANTAFMLLAVPLSMAVGLAIAMLLNQRVRGMRVYRTVFYLPAIVPVVASSLLWLWVLNPELGLLNSMLRMLGWNDPPRWLASPSWFLGSKTAIILMGLWGAGASMIIWLAGLKGIPRHLYESAAIDGAGAWRRFWNITLPMLSPYIFFNLVTGVIATMQIFTQAYIMTQGGPDDSTLFYAYYLFNNAFRYFRMGYASAMAWVLFVIVLALTAVQFAAGRKWVHYDTV